MLDQFIPLGKFTDFEDSYLKYLGENDPVKDLSYFSQLAHPIYSNKELLREIKTLNPFLIALKYNLRETAVYFL